MTLFWIIIIAAALGFILFSKMKKKGGPIVPQKPQTPMNPPQQPPVQRPPVQQPPVQTPPSSPGGR